MEIIFLILINLMPSCPAEGRITSEYGYRNDPITAQRKFHSGIDIANKVGTPVYAPWSGVVVKVSRSQHAGRFVLLQVGDFRLSFFHLQTATVTEGTSLMKGDQIGLMGRSGRVTGPHLHLELREAGHRKDPSIAFWKCSQN